MLLNESSLSQNALETLKTLKYAPLELKSHSMHSHKHFHTQGTYITLPSTQNTLNDFKKALLHSSLTNKP